MSKKVDTACVEVADAIEAMMSALHSRGFTREESVRMIAGMLSSTHVYAPMAGLLEGSPSSSMH